MTLTVRAVEALQHEAKSYTAWDDKLTAFGVHVQPARLRSYLVNYRAGDRHFVNRPIAFQESDWQKTIFFVSRSEYYFPDIPKPAVLIKMAKPGKAYEEFVAGLHCALLEAERIVDGRNIEVELNKIIVDNDGLKREFDVYWEYEIAGIQYRTVIECKDYNSSVSIADIDALLGKTQSIPGLRLAFATKKGYQFGAKTKAISNNVDLLIVREQNESDWYAPDGTPLLKEIHIAIMYQVPTIIHSFSPVLDVNWIEKHTDIDTSKPQTLSGLNTDISIEDRSTGQTYSLLELSNRLQPIGQRQTGRFKDIVTFEDAFLINKEQRFKMKSYEIEYTIPEAIKSTLKIDLSAQLDGVIEYLRSNVKATIFGDRVMREPMRESTRRQDNDS